MLWQLKTRKARIKPSFTFLKIVLLIINKTTITCILAKMKFWCAILLSLCLFVSCKRPDPQETTIQFLGHKGAGSNNYNDHYVENTLATVQYGLNRLDGVELDVQMSLDETIWIFHNTSLSGSTCAPITDTIPKMRDVDIEKLTLCHGTKTDKISKLADVINWANTTTDGFPISLDMKISFSANVWALWGTRDAYLLKFANSLAKILSGYRFTNKILTEVDSKLYCTALKNNVATKDIVTCFMRYEPMPEKIANAIKLGYDGISCNYTDPTVTAETVAMAKNAGLKVQLWTPYYRDQLRIAFAMQPDFIQTDNIYAKQALNVK